MTFTGNPCMWDHRWEALNSCIADLQLEINNKQMALAGGTPNNVLQTALDSLAGLTAEFKEFADSQFHFFLDGLLTKLTYEMGREAKYPSEYVLSGILYQMSSDYNVFSQIFAERVYGSAAQVTALDKADGLFTSAVNTGLITNKPHVLTYLQKDIALYTIPYVNVAAIGIPHTCTTTPRDFLAIAHEAGHYVFRNSTSPYKPQGPTDTIRFGWFEEIFADVYACLVAGPVVALSSQDVQVFSSQDEFVADTNILSTKEFPDTNYHHPIPAIRPYIYTEVLKRRKWGKWAEALETRWGDILQARGVDVNQFDAKRTEMLSVVNEILKAISINSTIFSWLDPTITKVPPAVADIDQKLYDAFGNFLQNTVQPQSSLPVPAFVPLPPASTSTWQSTMPCSGNFTLSDTWKNWVTTAGMFSLNQLPPTIPDMIPAGTPDSADTKRDGWVQVFVAGGWATRAPNSMW